MNELTPLNAPREPSAMLRRPRAVFAWLGRRLFDHVKLDPETADRVRRYGEQGQLVYVMRTRSLLDYLFFNYLFLKVGLPLAWYANGLNLAFFRGLGEWITDRWGRWFGRGPEEPAPPEALEQAVRGGHAALLFMKERALTTERQVSPGFIERLVAIQRTQDRPILLLPQLINWPRKPPSKRRTWLDILFGEQDAAGRLRKIVHFFRHSRLAAVQVGEPIDLKKVLEEHAGWSDARVARKVRRVLFIHLGHEAMAVRGPAVKPAPLIKREVLERHTFQSDLRAEAERLGLSYPQAFEQARKYLKEIAAQTSFEVILAFGRILDIVFNRVFQGVEVDEEGLKRVKQAARLSRSAPLVIVPSHKSHVDYLVVSWVLLRHGFIPPHIAAGINLSFFPVGWWLRRGGAFFLRRSFTGLPIYKLVFRRYLWKLLREGYPVEFFMEGGRSRTGKLLPPKMGMLDMLLDGIRSGEYKDLQFVPINLSYERVVETASYSRELSGGEKKTESVGQVVRASRILRSRYGRVYVSFEEPIRLSEYLAQRDLELDGGDEAQQRHATRRLAYHLMRRIQEATTVTPSDLVGAVLLSHDRRGMSGARLRELVGFLLAMLTRRGARLSRSVTHTLATHQRYIAEADALGPREGYRARGEALRPLLDEAMVLLKRLVQRVERGGEQIYTVPERSRIELDYYRNATLGILAPDAIVATTLRAADRPLRRDRLAAEVRRLSYWFRLEFVYETDATFEENFDDTVARLVDEGVLRLDGDLVAPVAPRTLDFVAGMLLHLVEGYWVAADALRALAHGPMDLKSWVDHAREQCEREFLEGELRRAEAASTAVLSNALELFRQEGLVEKLERPGGRRPTYQYALTRGTTLEHVAFRRDDIGFFLARRRHDPLPRMEAASAEAAPADALDEVDQPRPEPLEAASEEPRS